MQITVGIDIGAVSVKAAVIGTPEDREALDRLVEAGDFTWHPAPRPLVLSRYRRILGDPVGTAGAILAALHEHLPSFPTDHIFVTGSAGRLLQAREGLERVNEFKALAAASAFLHPQVTTIFEMGGQSSRFLRLRPDPATGQAGILDYETNGDCAAGTGAFIDQQATRLRYPVEEVGGIACAAPTAARVAGRCSVFAKSDMIHAQQKGATPPQILRGLCDAVARNFKGSITKGKPVVPPVVFLGGLASNTGVVQALRELYQFDERELVVPDGAAWYAALGAALLGERSAGLGLVEPLVEAFQIDVRRIHQCKHF